MKTILQAAAVAVAVSAPAQAEDLTNTLTRYGACAGVFQIVGEKHSDPEVAQAASIASKIFSLTARQIIREKDEEGFERWRLVMNKAYDQGRGVTIANRSLGIEMAEKLHCSDLLDAVTGGPA